MISKEFLNDEYLKKKKSVAEIAIAINCSQSKVNYWLAKHELQKRSLSESQYVKQNPNGDPFQFTFPKSREEWFLYGMGLGLYWGEGNKRSKTAVRLGNTDPDLLRYFLDFLFKIYNADETRLRFGLQIFTDNDPAKVKTYWCKKLNISPDKFQKIVITKSVRNGTYKEKSEFGVLTIYFSNTKIRDIIVGAIEGLRQETFANVAQLVERVHGRSQDPCPLV